jgi:hypothetical protein
MLALTDEHLNHAVSVLSTLRSAKAVQRVHRVARLPGTMVSDDGVATVTLAGLFGCAIGDDMHDVRVSYRVLNEVAKETEDTATGDDSHAASDDGDGGDGDDDADYKDTSEPAGTATAGGGGASGAAKPLAQALHDFQSGPVVQALIAAAGNDLGTVNAALRTALRDKHIGSKRQHAKALEAMPGSDDESNDARRKLFRVGQQAVGAAWTLVCSGMPGDSAAVAHGMQTVAKQVKADPAVLLGLPVVKDVFDTCLDTSSIGALRMCITCRTLGCRECRKHLAGEAALPSDEETGV